MLVSMHEAGSKWFDAYPGLFTYGDHKPVGK
jgi:hypothetical protein